MKTCVHFILESGRRLCDVEVPTFQGDTQEDLIVHVSTTNAAWVNCGECILKALELASGFQRSDD